MTFCPGCFERQRIIDELKEENTRLKAQLKYRMTKGFFGSSTPSSQNALKANSKPEQRTKRGGGQKGHIGHGRPSIDASEISKTLRVSLDPTCPDCARPLDQKGHVARLVKEIPPPQPEMILYELEKGHCSTCKKTFEAVAPGVLPRALFGNQLTCRVLALHYLYGVPLGRISADMGIEVGSLIAMLHRVGRLFEPVMASLIKEFREAKVRPADETSWRTDGHSGYAWLFTAETVSLFLFRNTRSSAVPKEIFGENALSGFLVVDRYNGYNFIKCLIQYCYAHLEREVEDLLKEFPDHVEVKAFGDVFIPLLSSAMSLHGEPLADEAYYEKAVQLKQKIVAAVEAPAQHPGVQRIQDIFRDHADRMYQWVEDRDVPADNNRGERELRPIVIARKVSFGSQSEEGAKTREILMSVIHTLKKRVSDPEEHLKQVLDSLARDLHQDPFPLLFGKLPCTPPESAEGSIPPPTVEGSPQALAFCEASSRGP